MEGIGILLKTAIFFGILFGIIFFIRIFGAWMLRINEIIAELKKINTKLDKMEKGFKNE